MKISTIVDRVKKNLTLRRALEARVPEGVMRNAFVLNLKDMDHARTARSVDTFAPDGKWSYDDLKLFFSQENDWVRFRLSL